MGRTLCTPPFHTQRYHSRVWTAVATQAYRWHDTATRTLTQVHKQRASQHGKAYTCTALTSSLPGRDNDVSTVSTITLPLHYLGQTAKRNVGLTPRQTPQLLASWNPYCCGGEHCQSVDTPTNPSKFQQIRAHEECTRTATGDGTNVENSDGIQDSTARCIKPVHTHAQLTYLRHTFRPLNGDCCEARLPLPQHSGPALRFSRGNRACSQSPRMIGAVLFDMHVRSTCATHKAGNRLH